MAEVAAGYYWVRFFDNQRWTVARVHPPTYPDGSSRAADRVECIASDESYSLAAVEVGPAISVPPGCRQTCLDWYADFERRWRPT